MPFQYNLKKTWIYLLISFIFCSLIGTPISYYLNNESKLSLLIFESIIYSLSLFHICMYFVIKYSAINKTYSKKNKYGHKVESFFEQTSKSLFKDIEPKINYFVLKYSLICILLMTLILSLSLLFTTDSNFENTKNNLSYFFITMLFYQFSINLFIFYIMKPILTHIIIKQFCYIFKKRIYNDSYLYFLKEEEKISIYKNGKLHCKRLPACLFKVTLFKNKPNSSNRTFLTYEDIKKATDEEIEKFYESYLSYNRKIWYLYGEIFKLDRMYSDKDVRKIIKLKESVSNF